MIRQRQPDPLASILAERKRQIEAEGFTPAHDDEHVTGELTGAAQAYFEWGQGDQTVNVGKRKRASPGDEGDPAPEGAEAIVAVPAVWPFEPHWFKPAGRRRDLERAGAFLMAERDRMIRDVDRRNAAKPKGPLDKLDFGPVNNRLQLVIAELTDLNIAEHAAELGASEK